MNEITKYLQVNIDDNAEVQKWDAKKYLNLQLAGSYEYYIVSVLMEKFLLIKPMEEYTISKIKIHINRITEKTGYEVAILMQFPTVYRVKKMMEERIAFITVDKQMYLPFMALHIKKNHNYEVVEDDLLYEEIIIYDHEGVSYKVSVLRDYMLAYYRDYECKEIYLKEEGNIFKLSIVGNKLIVDLVENVEEIIDRISYISDYINVRDGLNGKVYRIFINNGNLEAEISDNEEVFEQDLHIEGDNKHHYVLLTYNGLIRITPINYNRDPELDFYSIIFKTVSKNDSRYFRVYHNGRLIPRHVSSVVFPNYCDFTDAELRLGFKKQQGVHYNIAIECMPYMMKQVCYLNSIPTDKVINLKGLIDKPFDFKWYDIYLNGKKLTTKDVEIVSAHLIKVLKTDSVKGLEIIENSRDKEYFGGFDVIYDIIDELFENDKVFSDNLNNSVKENCDIKDNEIPTAGIEDVLIGSLDYILHHLYEFLLLSFGMINPDHNQLTMSDLYKFEGLVDKDTPLMIGFDIYGENRLDDERIVLNINPDE